MINSIQLKSIRKRYTEADFALHIDNLEFRNHSIHVVVGHNGCGKSSLLKLLALVDKPDEGSILFNNNRVFKNEDCAQLRKKTGFIMQNPYLFNTTVFENVALGLKIRKYPRIEIFSKVKKILASMRMSHLAQRKVRCLSRGEHQKAAIAQVLVLEPDLILMDEPAANIDVQSALNIEEIVKNAQERLNSLIIMTTHSLTQAYRMSPDIISMRNGKIIDFIHENVFFSEIKDFIGGLQSMRVLPGVEIILSTEKRGKGYITIDPGDIIISKSQVKTSARNTFSGKIIKIELLGPNVRVLIDIGVEIYSIITKQSFNELGINLGSDIQVNFKVNSVKVI